MGKQFLFSRCCRNKKFLMLCLYPVLRSTSVSYYQCPMAGLSLWISFLGILRWYVPILCLIGTLWFLLIVLFQIIDLTVWLLLPCWSWCNVQIVLYPGRTILPSWGVGLLITGWWSWIVHDFWILGIGLSHWLLWLEFMHYLAAVVLLIATLVAEQFLLFFIFFTFATLCALLLDLNDDYWISFFLWDKDWYPSEWV